MPATAATAAAAAAALHAKQRRQGRSLEWQLRSRGGGKAGRAAERGLGKGGGDGTRQTKGVEPGTQQKQEQQRDKRGYGWGGRGREGGWEGRRGENRHISSAFQLYSLLRKKGRMYLVESGHDADDDNAATW
jgi:hypothetical protein